MIWFELRWKSSPLYYSLVIELEKIKLSFKEINIINYSVSQGYPDYAKDYKNEFLFIRDIDKCFEYFLKNLNSATTGVFQNHRLEKIRLWLRRFDKFHPPNTKRNKIDEGDVNCSVILLEQLADFTDHYVNDQREFDIVEFCTSVDKDFPGWTNLVETIKLFHSKFIMVDNYLTF